MFVIAEGVKGGWRCAGGRLGEKDYLGGVRAAARMRYFSARHRGCDQQNRQVWDIWQGKAGRQGIGRIPPPSPTFTSHN